MDLIATIPFYLITSVILSVSAIFDFSNRQTKQGYIALGGAAVPLIIYIIYVFA